MQRAVASVKGGLFPENGVTTWTQITPYGGTRMDAAGSLSSQAMYALREVIETLTGVAPGAAALKQLSRIVAADDLSGARAIENVSLVGRVTTAADITEIHNTILSYVSRHHDPTPVPNLDGNPLGTR
jgi:hypothetical protein